MDLPLSDQFGNALVSFDSATGTDPLDNPAPMPLSLIVVVCAARVLMVLDAARGQWELPGGMREGDETARQAATRELAEETGITTADLKPAAVAGFDLTRPARREYAAVYQLALPAIPRLAADDEILDFQWWDPRSPLPENMSPLDAEIGRRVTGTQSIMQNINNSSIPALSAGRSGKVNDTPGEVIGNGFPGR